MTDSGQNEVAKEMPHVQAGERKRVKLQGVAVHFSDRAEPHQWQSKGVRTSRSDALESTRHPPCRVLARSATESRHEDKRPGLSQSINKTEKVNTSSQLPICAQKFKIAPEKYKGKL